MENLKPTIIVTGSDGHVGSTLTRLLVDKGYEVRGLIYHNSPSFINDEHVQYFRGDVADKESMRPLFASLKKGSFIVIHSAALIDIKANKLTPELFKTNVLGSQNVFELYKEYGGTRFIAVSSVDAFIANNSYINEESPLVPNQKGEAGYPISKSLATQFFKARQKEGEAITIIYPSAVLGPFDKGNNHIVQLLKDYLTNKLPGVIPGAYDVVDVRDLAEAIITASLGDYKGDSFIVSGSPRTLVALLETAKKWNHNEGRKILVFPPLIAKIGLPFVSLHCKIHHKRPLYTKFALSVIKHANTFNNERAKALLNYHSRPTEETINATLDYLRSEKLL